MNVPCTCYGKGFTETKLKKVTLLIQRVLRSISLYKIPNYPNVVQAYVPNTITAI